jgi:hypothetical protein
MNGPANLVPSDEGQSRYRCVDALHHWLAPEAVHFWEHRPADGIVIGRDVPSRPIARLLKKIIVFEPVDDRRDLKVRLAGTELRRHFEHDITGRKMSELFCPAEFPMRFRIVMEAIEKNVPPMARVVVGTGDCEVSRLELLTLPAIAPNGSDRWALVFCFYF